MRTMTIMAVCSCVLWVSAGAGCAVAPSNEASATVTDDLQRAEPGERATTTLPVRSDDLVDLATMNAALNAACPAQTTCPPDFPCTDWTPLASCGSPVCGGDCERCNAKGICFPGTERSTFNSRSRVCFDPNDALRRCTQFEVTVATTTCPAICSTH